MMRHNFRAVQIDVMTGGAPLRRIQELAKQTIAPPELEEQMAFQVGLLIQQYDLLAKQIELAERRVAELLDSELALRLQTIPGVGAATAATLIVEIGDIWRFDDFDQLAAYAGTHPKEQSSGRRGEKAETSWRMAKTGNSYLRSALYRMAVVGIQHNPIIKEHYRRKRQQGKAPTNAIGTTRAMLGHCSTRGYSANNPNNCTISASAAPQIASTRHTRTPSVRRNSAGKAASNGR